MPGVGVERAQEQVERQPAHEPREAVVDEQAHEGAVRETRRLGGIEAAEERAGERREDARVEQHREEGPEGEERPERRVDLLHGRQAGDEDEDPGDGREPGFEEDRAEDERGVVDAARAAKPDDAGERRPDAARDVLRQHRGHLGLERDPIGDANPERGQDPLPADDEQEVVGGEDRQRERRGRAGRRPRATAGPRPTCRAPRRRGRPALRRGRRPAGRRARAGGEGTREAGSPRFRVYECRQTCEGRARRPALSRSVRVPALG